MVLYESPRPGARDAHASCSARAARCGEVAVARELTKLHEEVWRGTLDEAVGHVELSEPRGEHVIVLAPAPPPPAANDDEVDAHVTAALAEGLSTRDAAARVARDLRRPAPSHLRRRHPPQAQARRSLAAEARREANRVDDAMSTARSTSRRRSTT